MAEDIGLPARFDAFCNEYEIPEKHHGSLRMLAGMAYVLGLELNIRLEQHEKEEKNDD